MTKIHFCYPLSHLDGLFGSTIPSITDDIKMSKDYVTNQQPNCEVMVVQRQDSSQS